MALKEYYDLLSKAKGLGLVICGQPKMGVLADMVAEAEAKVAAEKAAKAEATATVNPNPAKFKMAGTEGTWQYIVVAISPCGRVGYRDLGGETRVRVEPIDQNAAVQMAVLLGHGWKKPGQDDQFRYSTVQTGKAVAEAISLGLQAIGATVPVEVEVNPAAPDWAKELVFSGVNIPPTQPEPEAAPAETAAESAVESAPAPTTGTGPLAEIQAGAEEFADLAIKFAGLIGKLRGK